MRSEVGWQKEERERDARWGGVDGGGGVSVHRSKATFINREKRRERERERERERVSERA